MTTDIVVWCPYCGQKAQLVDSKEIYRQSYGMMWLCRPCEAYVGVHRDSKKFKPLGTLANAELRKLRNETHRVFDPLWKNNPRRTRKEAYALLANLMQIPPEQCHVAMFDKSRCLKAIELLKMPF